MPKKVSFEEFEQRLKNKFGDKFKYIDLSLIDKENFNYLDKYPIKCLIHNKIVCIQRTKNIFKIYIIKYMQ